MSNLAYVAYPIDFGNDLGSTPAKVAAQFLAELGWTAYLPGEAMTPAVDGPISSVVTQVNQAVMQLADLIIALWPEGVPSVGVPLDIEYGRQLGRPTYVVHTGWLDASWSAHHWRKVQVACWDDLDIRKALEEIVRD